MNNFESTSPKDALWQVKDSWTLSKGAGAKDFLISHFIPNIFQSDPSIEQT